MKQIIQTSDLAKSMAAAVILAFPFGLSGLFVGGPVISALSMVFLIIGMMTCCLGFYSMQPIGVLIHPTETQLPILRMNEDGTILVKDTYIEIKTTIKKAIQSGYELTRAVPDLREAWDMARECSFPLPGACHAN